MQSKPSRAAQLLLREPALLLETFATLLESGEVCSLRTEIGWLRMSLREIASLGRLGELGLPYLPGARAYLIAGEDLPVTRWWPWRPRGTRCRVFLIRADGEICAAQVRRYDDTPWSTLLLWRGLPEMAPISATHIWPWSPSRPPRSRSSEMARAAAFLRRSLLRESLKEAPRMDEQGDLFAG